VTKNKLSIKSPAEIEIIRAGGRELAKILETLASAVRPGITTRSLDTLARELIHQVGGEPSFLNYRPVGTPTPFPAALCVSVNDEVVHGIPGDRVLEVGDLVGLDLGLKFQGLYTDMAVTVAVDEISTEAQALLDVTRQALSAGIAVAKAGATTGDIGFAIATAISDRKKYGIVTEFGGHGVGHQVHEPPEVPNVGLPGSGERLSAGLIIAIEPMIIIGSGKVITADDGWTVKTKKGGLSAHFEHTVLVTDNGGEILTPLEVNL
jgi:methionyl aminopeptidase